jgi:hypothetical protein
MDVMATLLKNSLLVALLALSCVACGADGVGASPTAPSTMSAPGGQPRPVSSSAISIPLGQTVSRIVTVSDPPMSADWGPEPAVRFSVAIPASGLLTVQLRAPGPTGLTLWVNSNPRWGTGNGIAATERVQGGATYEIAVSIHDTGITSQSFELYTSLDTL